MSSEATTATLVSRVGGALSSSRGPTRWVGFRLLDLKIWPSYYYNLTNTRVRRDFNVDDVALAGLANGQMERVLNPLE